MPSLNVEKLRRHDYRCFARQVVLPSVTSAFPALRQSVMRVDPPPPISEKIDLQRLSAWVDQGRSQGVEARLLMLVLMVALGAQHRQLQRRQHSIQRLSHFFSLTRQFFGPLAEQTLQQHAPERI